MDTTIMAMALSAFLVVLGVMLGAWLTFRASQHKSPLPTFGGGKIKAIQPEQKLTVHTLPRVGA